MAYYLNEFLNSRPWSNLNELNSENIGDTLLSIAVVVVVDVVVGVVVVDVVVEKSFVS